MFRRVLFVALALLLCLSFTMIGCQQEAPKPTPTPAPTKPVEGPPLKVAVIGPMKFVMGQHMWYAAQMAADEINAAGGVKAGNTIRKIELVQIDDNDLLSVPDAVSAMEKACTVEKADVIIGGYRSEAMLAQQEVWSDNKKLMLGVGCPHPTLTANIEKDFERYKYFFRIHPPNALDGAKSNVANAAFIVEALKTELGIPKVKLAILAEKAAWVETGLPSIQQAMETTYGCEVQAWRPSGTATDMTGELTAIKSYGAQAILTLLAGAGGVTFAKQWAELEIPATTCGVNVPAMSKGFWAATGGKANYYVTNSSVVRAPFSPKSVKWWDDFIAKYNDFPNYTVSSYDALFMYKEAIEKAGSAETNAIIAQLEKTKYNGLQGINSFTKNHDFVWGIETYQEPVTQWVDGNLIAIQNPMKDRRQVPQAAKYVIPPKVVDFWKKK